MQQISLNGTWNLSKADEPTAIPATVPGCVHTDLIAHDQIEDPFFRDNELQQFWIGETEWTYQRTFELSASDLQYDQILLRCLGLDTLATLTLNGVEIAQTANMYRTYILDVKEFLVEGENTIEIKLAAPMPHLRQCDAEKGVMYAWSIGEHRLHSSGWLRKEPCNFGWDWGPMFLTSGIWRDIDLLLVETVRLTDLLILQDHHDNRVQLTLQWAIDQLKDASLSVDVEVSLGNELILAHKHLPIDQTASLTIEKPELWYPNGMGAQPLYTVCVKLYDGETALDTLEKRIGLRTLKLERHADEWGESFHFAANGIPFFAKGANWIPMNPYPSAPVADDYERLIADAAAANMNMLRVWGGGIYEDDVFYDLCDQYGMCVWQDFIFACGTYPSFDETFMANVQAEAEDNVRRIRHHASLALWCGNNEIEQGLATGDEWTDHSMSWSDYEKLFDVLLADVVATLDPQRDYWQGSPHSPCGERDNHMNPDCGDTHLWSVWHGKEPFEWYRTRPDRFVSEFGFQSFPAPNTLQTVISEEDHNITSYIMEHRQRSGIGNSTIIHYMLDWFRLPTSFEDTLWASQILQGMAMKYAVEHWRRNMPRSMGTLYWQLNDVWQAPSWSSIDYAGRWKALHHMARHFYAPILISGVEDMKQKTVEIHVTSDAVVASEAVAAWTVANLAGDILTSGKVSITLPANGSALVHTLDLSQYNPREILVWLDLIIDGKNVSQNLVLLSRPKHLNLVPPDIQYTFTQQSEMVFEVELQSAAPALWVWMDMPEINMRASDNFFHLLPNAAQKVTLIFDAPIAAEVVKAALHVRSLIDTYQ